MANSVSLDRALDGELDKIIRAAFARVRTSLDTARGLLASNFCGPAYVWAVRSVEVYLKEVVLLPLFLETNDGDWVKARKSIRRLFGSGNWSGAIKKIEQEYGPFKPMLTEDNENVWDAWKQTIVGRRGNAVHGLIDPERSETEMVIMWAGMMTEQLSMRLAAAGKHPLSDMVLQAIDRARGESS